VINCFDNSATTIIQGFTITGGIVTDSLSFTNFSKGGGIYIEGGSPVIQNNIITKNTVRGYDFYQPIGGTQGGGANGGGIYMASSTTAIIRNNVISENIAIGGGGKDFRGGWSGDGTPGGNAFGGGINSSGSGAAIIMNNTFYGNKANGGFGGSSNSQNAGYGGDAVGGALDAGGSNIVKNNIFSNNSAVGGSTGGGLNGKNGSSDNGAVRSFVAGNLSNNLYFNNSAKTNPDGTNLGTNNVVGSDPLFVSGTNFHLQTLSPARKAGTVTGAPTTDIEGTTRTNPPSIGAYDGSGLSVVGYDNSIAPNEFALLQNYPNPFNPTTNIEFTVPVNGRATLKVFNAIGQIVATLFDGIAEAGKYNQIQFNANGLATGIYFSRLESNGKLQLKKMLLIK
jgi:hypothetical protein